MARDQTRANSGSSLRAEFSRVEDPRRALLALLRETRVTSSKTNWSIASIKP
jgi:hypothetical protein